MCDWEHMQSAEVHNTKRPGIWIQNKLGRNVSSFTRSEGLGQKQKQRKGECKDF